MQCLLMCLLAQQPAKEEKEEVEEPEKEEGEEKDEEQEENREDRYVDQQQRALVKKTPKTHAAYVRGQMSRLIKHL